MSSWLGRSSTCAADLLLDPTGAPQASWGTSDVRRVRCRRHARRTGAPPSTRNSAFADLGPARAGSEPPARGERRRSAFPGSDRVRQRPVRRHESAHRHDPRRQLGGDSSRACRGDRRARHRVRARRHVPDGTPRARRTHAEGSPQQNARLFSEQRSVAQTLQHSLLPDTLPEFAGLDCRCGTCPESTASTSAATGTTSSVSTTARSSSSSATFRVADYARPRSWPRCATRSGLYAAARRPARAILMKLAKLINVGATAISRRYCAASWTSPTPLTFANAGHPNPLLITRAAAEFVSTKVGVPVGVRRGLLDRHRAVPAGAMLMAFTDGLFERRGESPDVGLARLRDASMGYDRSTICSTASCAADARRRSRRHRDPGDDMALVTRR